MKSTGPGWSPDIAGVVCAQPFTAPWVATLIGDNTILFTASPGNDLTAGDPFFLNIFFEGGDPNGASFSGSYNTPAPEPGSLSLMGSGVLGIAADPIP